MNRTEFKEHFIKLTKKEKYNITLGWLSDLVKNNHITINDIVEIIVSSYNDLPGVNNIENLTENNYINTSTISKLFGCGYAKSIHIIKLMIENNIIERVAKGYKIISLIKFIQMLKDFNIIN